MHALSLTLDAFARIGALVLTMLALPGTHWQSARADPPSTGKILTYAVPPGQPRGTNFTVEVRAPGGRWQSVETYLAEVNYHQPAPASMAEFDASGPVQISVTAVSGTMRTARVRPASRGITPTLSADGRTATFTLPEPMDVSFEANEDTQHNLQIFVNQKTGPKSKSAARKPRARSSGRHPKSTTLHRKPKIPPRHVVSFGAGIDLIPGKHVLVVPSNTTVDIAGGAVVVGVLEIVGTNVTVEGHGVIDPSSIFNPENSPPTVWLKDASDVGIRDVTILESQSTGFEIDQSRNVVLSHVREINAAHWSDGVDIVASSDVLVESSFLRTSDDSIAVFASAPWGPHGGTSDVAVRDCTLFPDVAHPVLVGTIGNPKGADRIEHLLFANLNILDQDEPNPLYQGTLAVDAGDSNTVSDLQFEDVDVEHIAVGQLFNVRVFFNHDYDTAPGDAVSDVFFRNVAFTGGSDLPSQIEGYEPARAVSGVTFENLTRNGQLVLAPSAGNIKVAADASAIVFRPTAPVASVDDSSSSLRYSGPWERVRAAGYFAGAMHVGSSPRSSVSLTFQGTQARLYGAVLPTGGTATVQVDGGPPVTIDTYAEGTALQQLWFDTGVLPAGRHTIQLRATGAGDALSSGARIALDRIDIVP